LTTLRDSSLAYDIHLEFFYNGVNTELSGIVTVREIKSHDIFDIILDRSTGDVEQTIQRCEAIRVLIYGDEYT